MRDSCTAYTGLYIAPVSPQHNSCCTVLVMDWGGGMSAGASDINASGLDATIDT